MKAERQTEQSGQVLVHVACRSPVLPLASCPDGKVPLHFYFCPSCGKTLHPESE